MFPTKCEADYIAMKGHTELWNEKHKYFAWNTVFTCT